MAQISQDNLLFKDQNVLSFLSHNLNQRKNKTTIKENLHKGWEWFVWILEMNYQTTLQLTQSALSFNVVYFIVMVLHFRKILRHSAC